jgi:hypothetical protein
VAVVVVVSGVVAGGCVSSAAEKNEYVVDEDVVSVGAAGGAAGGATEAADAAKTGSPIESETTCAFANGSAGVLAAPGTVLTFVCESAMTGTRVETRCVTVFVRGAVATPAGGDETGAVRGGACTFGIAKLGKCRSGTCTAEAVPALRTRRAAIVGAAYRKPIRSSAKHAIQYRTGLRCASRR